MTTIIPAKENTVIKKSFVASACLPSMRRRAGGWSFTINYSEVGSLAMPEPDTAADDRKQKNPQKN